MKIFGDVTYKDKESALELQGLENMLNSNSKKLPKPKIAKGYVILVYDWYRLGMEEEGNRILQSIDRVCPDYFKKYVVKDMEEDKKFDELIKKLFIEFAFLLTYRPEAIVKKVEV